MNRIVKHIICKTAGGFFLLVLFLFSCKSKKAQPEMAGSGEYYTCSMDPQVHENVPGNCPICHMNMIKVKKNELKKGQIKLSTEQILLAGIQWDTLRENNISKEILLTGKVAVNQTLAEAVSSKVKGRIDSLNVKNVGDYIHKGERLYQIYSEDMNSAQQEYLLAIGKEKLTGGDKDMLSQFKLAAKNKLLLFGMSEAQIVDLESKGKVMNRISIYAQTDGFVSDIFIAEGNYVESGTMLFHLSSLQSLWVEAEAYLSYLTYLKIGTDGVFSIPAAGEKTYNGKIIFIAPQVQSPERFVLARFEISNPTEKIKPGMMATITLQTGKKKALTLPLDAVIQDSKGATVWVRNPEGVFEIRMVKTGLQNSREIEVTEGLLEGDVAVTRGSYLLNSEYIFKNGANPMEGMDMKKKETMPGMNM